MVALKEHLGKTLESLGKGLQAREVVEGGTSPYGYAQRLWGVLAPETKIEPRKSAFLKFSTFDGEGGIRTESEDQNIFCNLLNPYRSFFPELDTFFVSLSLSNKADDISFKLTVFAPPLSQQVTHDAPYSVLTILELPEQKLYGGGRIPYNVLILGETELYTGKLDQEFVGLSPEKEGIFKEHREWSDEPEGDIEWRRNFASETLKFLTSIAETDKEGVVSSNQDAQLAFKKSRQEVAWWRRIISDERERQPGAVWPDNTNLFLHRRGYI